MGFDNDYFLTTGTIIPAYTLNTLITNFPIVGDIITAGSPEDGLLGASFKIEKKEGEFDISYNPISVFVPNLFTNRAKLSRVHYPIRKRNIILVWY